MKGLAALRIKKGLTQQALGDLFGLDNNTISRYERGLLHPSFNMLQRLAAFFNVSVDCLLNGPGPGEWNINIFWEVDETQALDIKKGEFAVGFRDSGDIMLWGNVPSEKTPDETAERVRIELSIAHEMRLAGKAAREKIEGAAPK